MPDSTYITIWFFIGVSLIVNGLLILSAGLYDWINPPENPVVLFHLHASVWWGAFLLVSGIFYCWRFSPRRVARERVQELEKTSPG